MMLVGLPSMANVGNVSSGLADGTVLDTWPDSSGLGNDLTATSTARPIYKTNIVNGMPVVRFDGSNDVMLLTEVTVTSFTAFAVYQTSGDNGLLCAQTANEQLLRIGDGGNNRLSYYTGGTPINSSTLSAARSAWNIAAITFSISSFTVNWYEAGTSVGSGGAGAGGRFGAVGALPAFSAIYTTGDIAEIIGYDNVLSGTDRANVEKYLGTKYGITVAGGSAVQPDTVTGLKVWWKADAL